MHAACTKEGLRVTEHLQWYCVTAEGEADVSERGLSTVGETHPESGNGDKNLSAPCVLWRKICPRKSYSWHHKAELFFSSLLYCRLLYCNPKVVHFNVM